MNPADKIHALGRGILKDVSRSFYLSMRVLPKGMRGPISLGYLLARASDTLADTEGLDPSVRSQLLAGFEDMLQSNNRQDWFDQLEHEVIPHQQHEGEKRLLKNLAGVFEWLDSLLVQQKSTKADHYQAPDSQSIGPRQHAAIMVVMGHILRGQRLDIERFELGQGFQMTLDAELEEYCYLVAGCVGEFWTEIGNISSAGFSSVDPSKLKRWGANYGKGLQLINILRDLPSDLKNGRCYLPSVDASNQQELMAESARWRARARTYLDEGLLYAQSLTLRRTRAATALPGLIGGRTLDLMDTANWTELGRGIKVPRREIYRLGWEALFI